MAVLIFKEINRLSLIIVDLSYKTGSWNLILPAVKMSLTLKASGDMIEVHPDFQQALSGGK